MEIDNTTELISVLRTCKIAIYGAGYVATRFYQSLKEHELGGNVFSFVTTTGSDLDIDGLSVVTIDRLEIDERMIVCVAVHESIKDDIIVGLMEKGFDRYIWIYPFLYSLMLGTPTHRNVKVPISQIWNAVRDDYSMAIRYLAIDNYYGRNSNGYEIYKKFLSLFINEKTAEKRLNQFIRLIKGWEQNGYDTSKCSSIFEDYKILDGMHRIAVASYFNQEYIMCNIYPMTKNISEIHSQAAAFTKQSALDAEFEPEIISLLNEANQRIEEQYK
ncbi:MAG: hypothetical protein LBS02_20185 [Hungatella sp.]|nr:hypothetical protein [Hungatella sp.]